MNYVKEKGEFGAERTPNAESLKRKEVFQDAKEDVLAECRKPGGEKVPDHAEEANSQITQVI